MFDILKEYHNNNYFKLLIMTLYNTPLNATLPHLQKKAERTEKKINKYDKK